MTTAVTLSRKNDADSLARHCLESKSLYKRPFHSFLTFDRDKLGKIRRQHLKERLKISAIAKFEIEYEQSLFFSRFSESSARARERRSRETSETRAAPSPVSHLQSRAWSFACLAPFARFQSRAWLFACL